MTNSLHVTITSPDGWRIEYHIGTSQRGFAATFDDKGHRRGGVFNARPAMIEEELAWFRREHADLLADVEKLIERPEKTTKTQEPDRLLMETASAMCEELKGMG